MTNEDLRYPVGKFQQPPATTDAERKTWINTIAELPPTLRKATADLTPAQLDTRYRDGGWTVRQVVHHVADSHINAYVRFRLALTEDAPMIKPYEETLWAELPDAKSEEIAVSLDLLTALHTRWSVLLGGLQPEQFARTYRHPEMGPMRLDQVLALYAWHSRHHVAHITGLRQRSEW